MGDWEPAQAAEFVRVLRAQLHKMTAELARTQRQQVPGRSAWACAKRMEAAALRRDIREAETLIDRLQHCYLPGNDRPRRRPPDRPRLAADRQR